MDRYGRQKPLGPKGKQSNDDQVMHTDFCDEFASLHVQCMSMNGYGSFCGGAQCCSCYDTGYGSFGGTSAAGRGLLTIKPTTDAGDTKLLYMYSEDNTKAFQFYSQNS